MRKLWSSLEAWPLGSWARAFSTLCGGALLAASLASAAAPRLEFLRAQAAQLLRDHQALQSRMRQVAKTHGRRDPRLSAQSPDQLRLELWRARESGNAAAVAELQRERSLREAQFSVGREADIEDSRRRFDVLLRPVERVDFAIRATSRTIFTLALLCLLGAARVFILGRVSIPTPAPDLSGWRRSADSFARAAAGAAWAWLPCVIGIWIAHSAAARGEEGGRVVAWLACAGLATIVGGAFAAEDVATIFSKREWWGPRLLAAGLRLLPRPGSPKASQPGEAAPEDPEAGLRLAFGVACLVAWLGAAALMSTRFEPIGPRGGALGLAAACLLLLGLSVYAFRARLARASWPLFALAAFASLALAGLPYAARLATGPAIDSQQQVVDKAELNLFKAQAQLGRLPRRRDELAVLDQEFQTLRAEVADPEVLSALDSIGQKGYLSAPNRKVLERLEAKRRDNLIALSWKRRGLSATVEDGAAILMKYQPMRLDYNALATSLEGLKRRAKFLGWLALLLSAISLRSLWLCLKECRAGASPDLGPGVVLGPTRWLWACAALIACGWSLVAVLPWLLTAKALWGSPWPWLKGRWSWLRAKLAELNARRQERAAGEAARAAGATGSGAAPLRPAAPSQVLFDLACGGLWVTASISIAVGFGWLEPSSGIMTPAIVAVYLIALLGPANKAAASWPKDARWAFVSLALAGAAWGTYYKAEARVDYQKNTALSMESHLSNGRKAASRIQAASVATSVAHDKFDELRRELFHEAGIAKKWRGDEEYRPSVKVFDPAERADYKAMRQSPLLQLNPKLSPLIVQVMQAQDRWFFVYRDLDASRDAVGHLKQWEREVDEANKLLASMRRRIRWGGILSVLLALASLFSLGRWIRIIRAGGGPDLGPAPLWRLGYLWGAALLSPLASSGLDSGYLALAPLAAWLLATKSLWGWFFSWAFGFVLGLFTGNRKFAALKLSHAVSAELPILTRYLLVTARQGLPVHEGLRAHAATVRWAPLRDLLERLADRMAAGSTMSQGIAALEEEEGAALFPTSFTAMLKAGEASSELPKALGLALKSVEADEKLGLRLKSMFMLPAITLTTIATVGLFILTFVVPTFKNIFSSFGAELPAPTRIIIELSDLLRYIFWPLLLIGWRSVVSWRRYGVGDARLLIPGMRKLLGRIAETRMCHGLALLLSAGYPADRALELLTGLGDGGPTGRALQQAAERIRRGESLSQGLGASAGVSRELLWACELGEHRGDLPDTLNWLGGHLEFSANRQIEVLSETMERSMTLVLGLMVGFFVIAMFLPMFSMSSLAGDIQ
jgi:type II secretory pathway component PulF